MRKTTERRLSVLKSKTDTSSIPTTTNSYKRLKKSMLPYANRWKLTIRQPTTKWRSKSVTVKLLTFKEVSKLVKMKSPSLWLMTL